MVLVSVWHSLQSKLPIERPQPRNGTDWHHNGWSQIIVLLGCLQHIHGWRQLAITRATWIWEDVFNHESLRSSSNLGTTKHTHYCTTLQRLYLDINIYIYILLHFASGLLDRCTEHAWEAIQILISQPWGPVSNCAPPAADSVVALMRRRRLLRSVEYGVLSSSCSMSRSSPARLVIAGAAADGRRRPWTRRANQPLIQFWGWVPDEIAMLYANASGSLTPVWYKPGHASQENHSLVSVPYCHEFCIVGQHSTFAMLHRWLAKFWFFSVCIVPYCCQYMTVDPSANRTLTPGHWKQAELSVYCS